MGSFINFIDFYDKVLLCSFVGFYDKVLLYHGLLINIFVSVDTILAVLVEKVNSHFYFIFIANFIVSF